jgi:hypothetical protein
MQHLKEITVLNLNTLLLLVLKACYWDITVIAGAIIVCMAVMSTACNEKSATISIF